MSLDCDAEAFLDRHDSLPRVDQVPIEESRRLREDAAPLLFGPTELVEFADAELPGGCGNIPVRVYHPGSDPRPTIIYFHGGGWVFGSTRTHHGLCAALASLSQCRLVSVDYRLAPENPFPAALTDAWEIIQWAVGQAGPTKRSRIAVAGDSAGGNIAAVCARWARDAGIELAMQLLIYPVCDADLNTESYRGFGEGYYLTRQSMRWFWDQYIGDGDRFQPDASPLRAENLDGLAPAIVLTAECDPLRDEGEAYAEQLRKCGVSASIRRYDGQIHGFMRLCSEIQRGRDALNDAAAALRGGLNA